MIDIATEINSPVRIFTEIPNIIGKMQAAIRFVCHIVNFAKFCLFVASF
jgi:hypothetical protein